MPFVLLLGKEGQEGVWLEGRAGLWVLREVSGPWLCYPCNGSAELGGCKEVKPMSQPLWRRGEVGGGRWDMSLCWGHSRGHGCVCQAGGPEPRRPAHLEGVLEPDQEGKVDGLQDSFLVERVLHLLQLHHLQGGQREGGHGVGGTLQEGVGAGPPVGTISTRSPMAQLVVVAHACDPSPLGG